MLRTTTTTRRSRRFQRSRQDRIGFMVRGGEKKCGRGLPKGRQIVEGSSVKDAVAQLKLEFPTAASRRGGRGGKENPPGPGGARAAGGAARRTARTRTRLRSIWWGEGEEGGPEGGSKRRGRRGRRAGGGGGEAARSFFAVRPHRGFRGLVRFLLVAETCPLEVRRAGF